ncbi:hypothetical protein ACT3TP_05410 [Glutamicibacter sp. AOP38-B1-38]|uniref:hypothetical protein n=1 Tax=unclassified Glutamicibacter TaxID=2627139 RepID=UPI000BB7D34E|nr:hypothetical protein [Glutamicibacter sp. BW80]
MGIEVTVLTALVTLTVLAGASIYLVAKYRRTHAAKIRESLIRQANKHGVASPESLANQELMARIHEAKRDRKQAQMKTA